MLVSRFRNDYVRRVLTLALALDWVAIGLPFRGPFALTTLLPFWLCWRRYRAYLKHLDWLDEMRWGRIA